MTPDITIAFPHLRNHSNDQAFKVALECIVDNTTLDYELLIEAVAERRDIYPVINDMAQRAKSDWLVLSNSDVFFAPDWAAPLYDAREPNTIVTGIIAECGAIGVNEVNWSINFGRNPQSFRRAAFEQWAAGAEGEYAWQDKGHRARGWYFPCLIHRPTFLELGGFDTSRGHFPVDAIDMMYWDTWIEAGKGFKRVKSFCYHLQAYSDPDPERVANHL